MQQPHPKATWNPEKDFWEEGQDIFGLLVAYSETWPPSGMTRSGSFYERPTWEPHTIAPVSSSSPTLPTPAASDFKRHDGEADLQRHSPGLSVVRAHFPH